MPTRRRFLTAAASLPALALFSRPSFAAQPEVFTTESVAINGYDPVAYFTQGKPVKGNDTHKSSYNGATWHFSSAENKAAFDAAPADFAPQFGGYCAYAVSRGYTAPTDPDAWSVYDGKLYLNYSLRARELWSADIPGNIAKGEANWPAVLSQ
ncbi:YHS domain-containing protein [Roseovarius faecimaris]|uniref:YHS domain-containing protein n=1 Tax=Roseovarius faecimaris TaxID=2494550 RepID=A0A6I6IUP3_9RHOB|nr:YHS domain-containing (seleno)protein [Roseovarius faecimaris]QGX99227.1 YHS domain-containing protein [Roseovarius faecimaris]